MMRQRRRQQSHHQLYYAVLLVWPSDSVQCVRCQLEYYCDNVVIACTTHKTFICPTDDTGCHYPPHSRCVLTTAAAAAEDWTEAGWQRSSRIMQDQ